MIALASLYLVDARRIYKPTGWLAERLTLPCKIAATFGDGPRMFGKEVTMYVPQETFGMRNFGQVDLGDRRRTARLVETVDRMCRHPGGTLPDKLNRPADLRAFYRLMNRSETTHEVLIQSHAACTRACIAALGSGVVLVLHDATELDYTKKLCLKDQLSQIGQGTHRGYVCHNSLAVRADTGAVLGLTSQILHRRAYVPEKETLKEMRERTNRESRLWVQAAAATGMAPAAVQCVDISDSLSDTFEYMAYELTHNRYFVLRSREDRRLETPVAKHDYLYAAVRATPASGQRALRILAGPGRSARTTTVKVAFTLVRLAPPGKRHGDYDKFPLELWAVRIWEPRPAKGEEPLEWILLTNVAVDTHADAEQRVDWYEKRPIIEEYHKGMKTGCSIEAMKFESTERLEPAIAVLSVVATTLLQLRDAARAPDAEKRLASAVIDPIYVAVLANHYGNRLGRAPTILKFYMHVARLGGHQNRKVDGMPGWLTLWRGWMKLQAMVDGYHAARPKNRFRCGNN
jgi:hypothetical protein